MTTDTHAFYRDLFHYRRQVSELYAAVRSSTLAPGETWQQWRRRHGSPSVPVLVPSARVAAEARHLGATRVIDCNGADLSAIRRALAALEASHD